MKQPQPRILSWLIVLIVIVISGAIHGCATGSAGKRTAGMVPITQIESRETDGKTEIVINGAEPLLTYTSYQVTEPLRLVIDISDADVSKLKDTIPVNKGSVLDIVPVQRDTTARLEVGLSQAAETKVYPSEGKLIVEFSKSIEETKSQSDSVNVAQAPVPPVEGASTPETAPAGAVPVTAENGTEKTEAQTTGKGTATVISAVKANAGKDGVKVVIAANGTVMPNIIMDEGKTHHRHPRRNEQSAPEQFPGAEGWYRQGSYRSAQSPG